MRNLTVLSIHQLSSQINSSSLQHYKSIPVVSIQYFTTQLATFISEHLKPPLLFILVSGQKSQHIQEPTSALFLVNSIVTSQSHYIPKTLLTPADDKVYWVLKAPRVAITIPDSSANPVKISSLTPWYWIPPQREDTCLSAGHVRQVLRHCVQHVWVWFFSLQYSQQLLKCQFKFYSF